MIQPSITNQNKRPLFDNNNDTTDLPSVSTNNKNTLPSSTNMAMPIPLSEDNWATYYTTFDHGTITDEDYSATDTNDVDTHQIHNSKDNKNSKEDHTITVDMKNVTLPPNVSTIIATTENVSTTTNKDDAPTNNSARKGDRHTTC